MFRFLQVVGITLLVLLAAAPAAAELGMSAQAAADAACDDCADECPADEDGCDDCAFCACCGAVPVVTVFHVETWALEHVVVCESDPIVGPAAAPASGVPPGIFKPPKHAA